MRPQFTTGNPEDIGRRTGLKAGLARPSVSFYCWRWQWKSTAYQEPRSRLGDPALRLSDRWDGIGFKFHPIGFVDVFGVARG